MRRLTMLGLALLLVLAACGTAPLGVCHPRGEWPPRTVRDGFVQVCCDSGVTMLNAGVKGGKAHGHYETRDCNTGERVVSGRYNEGAKCGQWWAFDDGRQVMTDGRGPC